LRAKGKYQPIELDRPFFGVQRLPNGNWLVRAPTGDPVGPRVDVAAVINNSPVVLGVELGVASKKPLKS
jgi:hypothetical protein